MSICDKLNELIEKKGGKPIKNGTISEAVDALVDLDGGSGGGGGMIIDFDNLPSDKKAFWESVRDAINAGVPVDGYYSNTGGAGNVRLTANRLSGGQIFFTGVEWKYDYMSEAYGNSVYLYGLTLNMSGIEKFESRIFTLTAS